MKRSYTPTESDRLTGENVRAMRKRRGETLKQTVQQSAFGRDASTLAAVERGERMLTEIEATRLAAHFNTTVDRIFVKAKRPALVPVERPETEQEFLGNAKPALFAVPSTAQQQIITELEAASGHTVTIDLENPMHPDQYRAEIWVPYLEARYAADKTA